MISACFAGEMPWVPRPELVWDKIGLAEELKDLPQFVRPGTVENQGSLGRSSVLPALGSCSPSGNDVPPVSASCPF